MRHTLRWRWSHRIKGQPFTLGVQLAVLLWHAKHWLALQQVQRWQWLYVPTSWEIDFHAIGKRINVANNVTAYGRDGRGNEAYIARTKTAQTILRRFNWNDTPCCRISKYLLATFCNEKTSVMSFVMLWGGLRILLNVTAQLHIWIQREAFHSVRDLRVSSLCQSSNAVYFGGPLSMFRSNPLIPSSEQK